MKDVNINVTTNAEVSIGLSDKTAVPLKTWTPFTPYQGSESDTKWRTKRATTKNDRLTVKRFFTIHSFFLNVYCRLLHIISYKEKIVKHMVTCNINVIYF